MGSTAAGESTLTLNQVADRLGVHYMTVYRQIRTGRLPATKVGGEWLVQESTLRELEQTPPPQRRRQHRQWDELLVKRLLVGDEAGAWQVLQDCLASGHDPDDLYLDVIAPAMQSIGTSWERGTIDVSEEHVASSIATRLLGRLGPLFGRRGRRKGVIVLGAPPSDLHALPVTLLADPLRGRGFQVLDLGADVPAVSWAAAVARADRPLAIGVCATSPDHDGSITDAIRSIRDATSAPIFLGGHAIEDEATALRFGADHWTKDATTAIDLVEDLLVHRRD